MNKKHCDVCDDIIDENKAQKGGHLESHPLFGWSGNDMSMDLCLPHYNSLSRVLNEWKNFEQGFMATFPDRKDSRPMSNNDPAAEAAKRANEENDGWPWDSTRDAMVSAAREALKPIRLLHRAGLTGKPRELLCGECMTPWPCTTAKLIYPESELL